MDRCIKLILIILSTSLFMGCATFFKEEAEKKNTQLEYPSELEKAQDLFVNNRPIDALASIDHFLNKAEKIHWFGHAYFLKAYLYEASGDMNNAKKFYREAIEHGSQYEGEVEAKALYNLSFVYEKENEIQKMLVTLVDLMKRKRYFKPFISRVEFPARLAAAYASIGRVKMALGLHGEAVTQYEKMIRRNITPESRTIHSKILYYLGLSSFDQNNESFSDLMLKLSAGQKYYLYCAEASSSAWANECRSRLKNQYARAWGLVLDYKPKNFGHDPLAFKRHKEDEQLNRASSLYDLMFQLRAEEFPLADVNRNSKSIMTLTQDWIDKIEKFTIGLDLGPAMVRNKKIKNSRLVRYAEGEQEPVMVNKESSQSKKSPLESVSKKVETEEKDLPTKAGTPENTPESIGQDPNL